MKPTASVLKLIMSALVLCGAGCTVTTHSYEARPVQAVLEIRINGQWQTMQRVRYVYPMPEPFANVPTVELERLCRQAEAVAATEGDWSKVAALRVLIEMRKAGIAEWHD